MKSIKSLQAAVKRNHAKVAAASKVIQAASRDRNAGSGGALQKAYAAYDAAYETYRESLAELIIAQDAALRES